MPKIITVLLLTIFSASLSAQSDYEQFKTLFKTNDTAKIKTLLAKWERSNPNDPELYTSAINYYFSNSRHEVLSLGNSPQGKESFRFTDSTGKVVGFINPELGYNAGMLAKTFHYANTGIAKFPRRLDIRFGKCYALGEIGDYENFTAEVLKTIEYSKAIHNDWLWTENKKLENAESFFLKAIHDYLKTLYNTEADSLLGNMKRIGDLAIKYYPDNIQILSLTSVAYIITGDYDPAIAYLKHAETLNPSDFIVLNNIAHGYKLKGDKKNALKYYELTEKYGDERAKQAAQKEIKKLNQ